MNDPMQPKPAAGNQAGSGEPRPATSPGNVVEAFREKLDRLTDGKPGVVAVDHQGHLLRCELAGASPLACTFTQLSYQTDALAGVTVEELSRISRWLAARVTYLLEPLAPVELDSSEGVVQMRSTPPQQQDDETNYYELVIRQGGQVAITRFQQRGGGARQNVPATLTREVLLRLVGDLVAAVHATDA